MIDGQNDIQTNKTHLQEAHRRKKKGRALSSKKSFGDEDASNVTSVVRYIAHKPVFRLFFYFSGV